MNLLLDTPTALWWWTAPEKLSPASRGALTDRANTCFFSAASGYELALKQRGHPALLPSRRMTARPPR